MIKILPYFGVRVTDFAATYSRDAQEVITLNSRSTIGRITTEAFLVPEPQVNSKSTIGRIETKIYADLIEYNRRFFVGNAFRAIVYPEAAEFSKPDLLGLVSKSTIGRIQTKARLTMPYQLNSRSTIGPIETKADIFVPFAMRSRSSIGAVETKIKIFIPPFEIRAKSLVEISTKALLLVPLNIKSTARIRMIRTAAVVQQQYEMNGRATIGQPYTMATLSLTEVPGGRKRRRVHTNVVNA